ncbi:MAG: 30S ribosomal protein S6 [Clostridia bacterium]|nr:30S ribosomal protein S6 [Clostridia bacterium]
MEKVQGNYETLFIVDPSLGDEGIESVVNKFSDLIAANGTVEKVEKWGTRQLAYAIDKKADGYYALITFTSDPGFTPELERIFNITDGVMRSIVVRLDK